MLNVECFFLMLNVDLVGVRFVECILSPNDDAKKVQTRTELSLLKLCRVQPFFETALQRYGNFLILPNFTLQSYVKQL